MAVDPRARRELQRKLEEVLGEDRALTLMEYLPQERAATRAELEELGRRLVESEGRTDLKLEAREHRVLAVIHQEVGALRREMHEGFGGVRRDMAAQARAFTFSMIGAVVTVGGLAVAAGRFA